MSDQAAARLQRFNAFMQATAAQAAAAARAVVEAEVAKLNSLTINEPHLVAAALAECRAIDSTRAALTERILSGFAAAHARRDALVAALGAPTFETPPALVESPAAAVAEALLVLASEAEELEQRAQQGGASAEDRGRLAALKDRGALKAALPGVLARRDDIGRFLQLKSCRQAVATADISRQITSLRRKMVSEGLEERIQAEIAALDLAHAPFVVNDRSKEGQSLFEVGLKTPGKIANRHVLSEGEQRALALACFLAEVGGDACGHGMLIDDPVSSLDQNRIRKVAERLVAVANQGRQVIVFTHNLVFYNELAAAAAASEPPAPLLKVQISRNAAEGFGLIAADREPWFATSVAGRVEQLDARLKEIGKETAFDTDGYRRLAKDFYTDLRESWERLVEEVLLNKVVERFNTDVRTQSLSGTLVEDADFKKVFFAMRRASERSGHDMAAGKAAGAPTPPQMKADLDELRDYRAELIKRRKQVESARKAMLEAPPAEVV